jgi:hypothetical protein
MPISAKNHLIVAMLTELHLQCSLFERALKELRKGARHWRLLAQGKDFDRKYPPLDILAWSTVCLASFARTRHILDPGSRQGRRIRARCRALRGLLTLPPMPNVCSPLVRNSWEHMDERLDAAFAAPRFSAYSHLSVAIDDGLRSVTAFRRFDPKTLTLSFGNESLAIKACIPEMRGLATAIRDAMASLNDGRVIRFGA